MSDDYLGPERGHRFFEFARTRPDAYTWMDRSLSEYAHMYRESADLLMTKACDAPGLLNAHAIPAVYPFRHFVELSLKDLLISAGRLAEKGGTFPDGHRLEPLWMKLRALLQEANLAESAEDRATLDVVDEMIRELDSVDGRSMAFRYPVGTSQKDGGRELLLCDDFEYFDMRIFRDQAERLANFFGGCDVQMQAYLDIEDELDREYQDHLSDEW